MFTTSARVAAQLQNTWKSCVVQVLCCKTFATIHLFDAAFSFKFSLELCITIATFKQSNREQL